MSDPRRAPRVERPAMHDYGVPAEVEGALPWSWAETRLVTSRNYWLATASSDGRPHAMPVWGVWSPADQAFFTGCSPNARKARNLAANPRCVVAADSTGEVVSVEGTAVLLIDAARRDAAIEMFAAKYGHEMGEMPVDEYAEFMRSHPMYEFTPERAFGIIETPDEFAAKATRWVW